MPVVQKATILVVEDDPEVRNLIVTTLDANGYRRLVATTGRAAIAAAATDSPDIVLLDLGLPDIDGVEVVHAIRSWSQMPIIVVSARAEDQDKIRTLDAGADDYLTKPFSVGELLARIRTTLRRLGYQRSDGAQEQSQVFVNGDLRIDYAAGVVTLGGEELHLTPIEYKLLCLLSRNVGKVLTHQYILDQIWGDASYAGSDQGREGGAPKGDLASLRVYMGMLRKKIEKDTAHPRYIQTHVGVGYRMISVDPNAAAGPDPRS